MKSLRVDRHPTQTRRGFPRDENGASLVEFALVIALVLVLFFAILDFGRIGFAFVAGQKAVQNAARLAAVSPSACLTALPPTHDIATGTTAEFGTNCSVKSAQAPTQSVCKAETTIECQGENATATAIFEAVQALLPPGATRENLYFRYSFDERLGFLGGPYTPMVTVDLVNAQSPAEGAWIAMISPLGPLLQLVGGATGSQLFQNGRFTLPVISVSMPGESLE